VLVLLLQMRMPPLLLVLVWMLLLLLLGCYCCNVMCNCAGERQRAGLVQKDSPMLG
jgi:hypothetical protein